MTENKEADEIGITPSGNLYEKRVVLIEHLEDTCIHGRFHAPDLICETKHTDD